MQKLTFILLSALLISSCTLVKPRGKGLNDVERLKIQTVFIEAIREKNLGNLDKAMALLQSIVEVDKKHDASFFMLANISAMKNNFSEALAYSKKALAIAPDNKYYQLQEAGFLDRNAKYSEAAVIYKSMRQADPGNMTYYLLEADCYLKASKLKEAIEVYNAMEKKSGVSEELSMQKYKIYSYENQGRNAINELVKLSESDPANYDYLGLVVEGAFEQSQMNLAYEYINKLMALDSTDGMNYLYLAHYCKTVGKTDEYETSMLKGFADPRVEIDQKVSLLMEFYLKNSPRTKDLSYKLLDLLTRTHPDEAKGWAMFGDFLNRDNKSLEANEKFKKAIALDNSQFSVWQQMLINFDALRQYDTLTIYAEKAFELFPEQALAAYFAGYGYFVQKSYAKSITFLEQAIDLSGKMKEVALQANILLGDAYHYTKQNELSDNAFEKALAADNKNVTVLNNYAYYLALRKESLDKALSMIDLALKIEPDNGGYRDTKAWVLFQQGKYDEALVWIGKALDSGNSSDGAIIEHYGDILFKLGRIDEAVIQWDKASFLKGGSDLLEKKLKYKNFYE